MIGSGPIGRTYLLCCECKYWVKGSDKGRCTHPKRQRTVTHMDITRVSANDYCTLSEAKDDRKTSASTV